MLEGETAQEPVRGISTATVAFADADPYELVQVSVYVVVTPGETVVLPGPNVGSIGPTPWSMEPEVEFELQEYESTELPPGVIESGFAEMIAFGNGLLQVYVLV